MSSDNIVSETYTSEDEIIRKRSDDFISRYANNVYLESTLWDLKLIFGHTDLAAGNLLLQDIAVVIPWPQVKVFCYFLTIHLGAHEADCGRIKIPAGIIPPPETAAEGIRAFVQKFYEEFIAANPEVAPPGATTR